MKCTQLRAESNLCHNIATVRLAETNRLVLLLSLSVMGALFGVSILSFLTLTSSPRDIGAGGVTIWFISLFVTLMTSLCLIRYSLVRRRTVPDERLALYGRKLRSSTVIALIVTVALAMQSLRTLNIGDVLLFLLILAIIELYFRTK